jgi:hypothetical protein
MTDLSPSKFRQVERHAIPDKALPESQSGWIICLPGLPDQSVNNSSKDAKNGEDVNNPYRDPCSEICNTLPKRKSANYQPGEYTGYEFLKKGDFGHATSN